MKKKVKGFLGSPSDREFNPVRNLVVFRPPCGSGDQKSENATFKRMNIPSVRPDDLKEFKAVYDEVEERNVTSLMKSIKSFDLDDDVDVVDEEEKEKNDGKEIRVRIMKMMKEEEDDGKRKKKDDNSNSSESNEKMNLSKRVPMRVKRHSRSISENSSSSSRRNNQHKRNMSYLGKTRPPVCILKDPKKLEQFILNEKRKRMVIEELIVTEEDYVYNIQSVKNMVYFQLLKKKIISKEELKNLFGNLMEVIKVGEEFLKKLNVIRKTAKMTKVGMIYDKEKLFIATAQHMRKFAVYSEYIKNFVGLETKIQDLKEKNEKFKEFIDEYERVMRENKLRMVKLQDYLILPVQRVPRYELIVKTLLKTHSKNYIISDKETLWQKQEKKLLEKCLVIIKEILEYAQRQKKLYLLDFKISILAKELQLDSLIQEGRHLLFEELETEVKSFNEPEKKKADVYLFTDCIIMVIKLEEVNERTGKMFTRKLMKFKEFDFEKIIDEEDQVLKITPENGNVGMCIWLKENSVDEWMKSIERYLNSK